RLDRIGVNLCLDFSKTGDREEARQAQRRVEDRGVRGERVEHAVDVAGADVEGGDALRRMGRAEHDEPNGRRAVLLRLAELLTDGPTRHAAVLRLDHHPQVRAARPGRIDRDDAITLLRPAQLAGLATVSIDQVTESTSGVSEQGLEDVLE